MKSNHNIITLVQHHGQHKLERQTYSHSGHNVKNEGNRLELLSLSMYHTECVKNESKHV